MKRRVAVAVMAGAIGLAGCGERAADAGAEREIAAEAGTGEASLAPTPALKTEVPLVTGAPAFAVMYPGGTIEAPATLATGAAGPGGLVAFRTDAGPEEVVAFYRAHAEAAGLSSVMAMNMGDARSYGASEPETGANLQVVASPVEGGQTSVQISWSAGR